MAQAPARILVLGAHPDDAEYHVGGLLALHAELGSHIKIVSLTDGSAGHQLQRGAELANRRQREGEAAARVIGATFEAWDIPDGALQPSLEHRLRVIREIRRFRPDLVLTHRLNDYHPDHRATAQLVQDASYMVTVPPVAPDVPRLERDPVVAFMSDLFNRPAPMEAQIVVDASAQIETIVAMLACHVSQVFEWLPFHDHLLAEVPAEDAARRAWLRRWLLAAKRPYLERYAGRIREVYGARANAAIELVEILEISEYARPLDAALRARLFPFVPA